jgi:AhpD family alkylhydroperoxidase
VRSANSSCRSQAASGRPPTRLTFLAHSQRFAIWREISPQTLRPDSGDGVCHCSTIATAQLNGCEYCLSSHTYIGANITKVEAAELEKARKGESNDPHVAALLKLSNTIAQNAGDVDEADISAARQAGVTEEEIGELVANLALNTLTNYFNVMARVDNDWPVVSL